MLFGVARQATEKRWQEAAAECQRRPGLAPRVISWFINPLKYRYVIFAMITVDPSCRNCKPT